MKLREIKSLAISASFLVLCAACSFGDKDGVDLATPWLGPLNGFERISGKDEFGIFLKSTSGATARFERGIITPPELIVSAGSDLEAISPDAYEQINALFSEIFRQELAKQIPTTNTGAAPSAPPGAASHLIQAAMTNLTITRKTNNPAAVRLNDLQFSFDGSTIEAEIRDRKSNVRRAVILLPATAGKTDWAALRAQFTKFARQAAAEVGKARSAINTRADQPPPPTPKTPAKK
jgi:hypothetical protein